MQTKIYKITQWVKPYETIGKIQFLLGVGFTALCVLILWKTERRPVMANCVGQFKARIVVDSCRVCNVISILGDVISFSVIL